MAARPGGEGFGGPVDKNVNGATSGSASLVQGPDPGVDPIEELRGRSGEAPGVVCFRGLELPDQGESRSVVLFKQGAADLMGGPGAAGHAEPLDIVIVDEEQVLGTPAKCAEGGGEPAAQTAR
ncbi:hypothetical protein [Streptomyces malaysiensis]|uniref:hypothetical protein n=1 Tax=Streptomyces malaysiensis TaxID=92644 RepID=UPI0037169B53